MGHHCCSKQKVKRGLWSPEEDDKLIKHITTHGHRSWSSVPKLAGIIQLKTLFISQVTKYIKIAERKQQQLLNKVSEDGSNYLLNVIIAGLQRCGKSCRLRWINYLRPDLKRGSFTSEEEQIIIDVHRILGNRQLRIKIH